MKASVNEALVVRRKIFLKKTCKKACRESEEVLPLHPQPEKKGGAKTPRGVAERSLKAW